MMRKYIYLQPVLLLCVRGVSGLCWQQQRPRLTAHVNGREANPVQLFISGGSGVTPAFVSVKFNKMIQAKQSSARQH